MEPILYRQHSAIICGLVCHSSDSLFGALPRPPASLVTSATQLWNWSGTVTWELPPGPSLLFSPCYSASHPDEEQHRLSVSHLFPSPPHSREHPFPFHSIAHVLRNCDRTTCWRQTMCHGGLECFPLPCLSVWWVASCYSPLVISLSWVGNFYSVIWIKQSPLFLFAQIPAGLFSE